MLPADIRLVTASPEDISAWQQGETALQGMPEASSATYLWLTLQGTAVAEVQILQEGTGAVVATLYQDDLLTPPENVWPYLTRFRLLSAARKVPLYLVLCGDNRSACHTAWLNWLTLTTHGDPPLNRLLIGLLFSALPGRGIRLLRWLKHRLLG